MKAKVPEAMMLAVANHAGEDGRVLDWNLLRGDLEAALGWLDGELAKIAFSRCSCPSDDRGSWSCESCVTIKAVRRMFAAPDEAIADLLYPEDETYADETPASVNKKVREAYRRGLGRREGKVRG